MLGSNGSVRRVLLQGAVLLGLVCNLVAASTTNLLLPGTRFATECYVNDSGKPGPTVMIVGGAHGNEPAGALAAAAMNQWTITQGKLVIIPRSNVPALEANRRLTPNTDTNLNNLNRNYPRSGRNEAARGEIAQAIWRIAQEYKPDWMLDLHEGFDFNQVNDKSVGSSVISSSDARSKELAVTMLAAVNSQIADEKLKFSLRGPPIDGSLARAASEYLHIPAMTLETTSKQPMETRVRQHEVMVHSLLSRLGMMPASPVPQSTFSTQDPRPAKGIIRIAIYKGPGTGGAGPTNLLAKLNRQGISSIEQVTPEQIQSGILTNFDVAIFGGGSGSKQAEALGVNGRAAVRDFVAEGGGYIGICAGAYLATSGYTWSLGLVNARTVSPKWRRGRGPVKLELTEIGQTILGKRSGQFDCLYANGPIVTADTKPDLPAFETLAWFRTELAENDSPVGAMVNSPAILSSTFKRGRVVCVSPHPEQTVGLEKIIPGAVTWVAAPQKSSSNKTLVRAE